MHLISQIKLTFYYNYQTILSAVYMRVNMTTVECFPKKVISYLCVIDIRIEMEPVVGWLVLLG